MAVLVNLGRLPAPFFVVYEGTDAQPTFDASSGSSMLMRGQVSAYGWLPQSGAGPTFFSVSLDGHNVSRKDPWARSRSKLKSCSEAQPMSVSITLKRFLIELRFCLLKLG